MPFVIRDVDRAIYEDQLAGFLPPKLIDIHTHVWLKEFVGESEETGRTVSWPSLVAEDNAIADLLATYRLMFPRQKVTPLIFSSPSRGLDFEKANGYISRVAGQFGLPCLLLSTPEWTAEELERRVERGGFLGLKPYLSFAPAHLSAAEITIYDFLPHDHLEVANAHGWIVILHIPRPARLRDPVNLEQMLEIERRYPRVKLIVAHVGRAYCRQDVEAKGDHPNAFDALRDAERLLFDFSANTNAWVMARLIRTVGPKRILFGSDLPILRMRMRRICENGVYVNLVPQGLYGDVSGDPHMREVGPEEGARLSFFMYEELLAFRQAAEETGLDAADLDDVFYNNAARVLGIV